MADLIPPPDGALRDVAEEYWDTLLEVSPTTATVLGDHRFDDQLEDLSAEAEADQRRRWRAIGDRLATFDCDRLGPDDRVTHGQLAAEISDAIAAIDQRLVELQSDHMTGFHIGLLMSAPVVAAPDPVSARMLVERFRRIPAAFEQAAERFSAGVASGRTPAAITVSRSINMIEGYLASPLDHDSFTNVAGPVGWDGEAAWRDQLTEVTRDVIRPAYERLAATLSDRLSPVARDDDHCGLSWLADGPAIYATLIRHHTTVALGPDEIHRIGMDEVTEKLPGEYAAAGGRLFGISEPAGVFERLRNDPSLRYHTGDEIMADARRMLASAAAVMADWFGRLPQAVCAIDEVPEFLAADSPAAYYFPPAADGARAGTYFVNTHHPEAKPRCEAASIACHEAIPGHHLQLSIASELSGLPRFRRFSLTNTAYVEGWGLYSERLADEMGLYLTDLDRLGMLSADSLRACRLVVDTGLHALGWSRARAVAFMAAHTPMSVEEVTVEVDRYIAMPGQALAYKLGQREIFRLREQARTSLGADFDIKGFHDVVLGSGAVSLPILGRLVSAWVRERDH